MSREFLFSNKKYRSNFRQLKLPLYKFLFDRDSSGYEQLFYLFLKGKTFRETLF